MSVEDWDRLQVLAMEVAYLEGKLAEARGEMVSKLVAQLNQRRAEKMQIERRIDNAK